MKQFYILVEQVQEGPLSLHDVMSRNLSDETLVWRLDWPEWRPYASVREALEKEYSALQEASEPYYLSTLTERIGSFSLEELERQPHLLNQAVFVWKQGMTSWVELDKVEELRRIKERWATETATQQKEAKEADAPQPQGSEPPPLDPSFSTATEKPKRPPMPNGRFARSVRADSLWRYFFLCFSERFATFSGRARRSEFWGFILFFYLFTQFVFAWREPFFFWHIDVWPDGLYDLFASWKEYFLSWEFLRSSFIIGSFSSLIRIICLIPLLAVSVRRLHDIGYSAWYLLFGLIPFVGWVILIIFFCMDSEEKSNKYGPSPKYRDISQE